MTANINNRNDIMNAKTSDLIAFYNANSEKQVTKFADRRTAEKRCMAIVDGWKAKIDAAKKPAFRNSDDVVENIRKAEKAKSKTRSEMASIMSLDTRAKMSAAIRESWNDTEVAAARKQRSAVLVDGVQYRSVGQAFEELGLPMSKCIKFRGELKAAGSLSEFGLSWKIIPLNY